MKTVLMTAAALLMLTAPAFAFGASNPVLVDDPAVPNCTILNPVAGCETVVRMPNGGKSMVTYKCSPDLDALPPRTCH
jgi:hypothetical protein